MKRRERVISFNSTFNLLASIGWLLFSICLGFLGFIACIGQGLSCAGMYSEMMPVIILGLAAVGGFSSSAQAQLNSFRFSPKLQELTEREVNIAVLSGSYVILCNLLGVLLVVITLNEYPVKLEMSAIVISASWIALNGVLGNAQTAYLIRSDEKGIKRSIFWAIGSIILLLIIIPASLYFGLI